MGWFEYSLQVGRDLWSGYCFYLSSLYLLLDHGSNALHLLERQAGQLTGVPRLILFGPVTEEGRVCPTDRL